MDVGLAQTLDDIATGFRLQLPLQQVFLAGKVGLEIVECGPLAVEHLELGFIAFGLGLVDFLLEVFELLVIDRLLAFQQLEAHVGCSEVAADADEVGVMGSVAIDHLVCLCLSDAGDADGQSGVG